MSRLNLDLDERRTREIVCARNLLRQVRSAGQLLWVFMPLGLGDALRSQLLPLNSVVTGHFAPITDFSNSIAATLGAGVDFSRTLILINLDKYLQMAGVRSMPEIREKSRELCREIKTFPLERVLVHTTYIDSAIKDIFFSENTFLVQKSLGDDKVAAGFLQKIIPVFLPERSADRRNYIRVVPDDNVKVKFELFRDAEGTENIGVVEDYGLGGISVTLPDEIFEKISLKDFARLQLWFPRNVLKVERAVVAWKKPDLRQVGFFFDSMDPRMISEGAVSNLADLILNQIKLARRLVEPNISIIADPEFANA